MQPSPDRRTGTVQAQAFRQRYDPVETPAQRRARMITEGLLVPDEKTRRLLDRAHHEGDTETVNRLRALWAAKVRGLLDTLKRQGIDLSDLVTVGEDPAKATRALSALQAVKADGWDKLYEYWRNSILSGLPTQVADTIGNFTSTGWHFTAERLVEAMINTIARRPEGAQWGEFRYILGGVLPGLSRGARNFLQAFRTELPAFMEQIGAAGRGKIEEPNVAIWGLTKKGYEGRIIRIPQRFFLAADELSKSLIAEMEVGAQAYRIAKGEGLRGDALRRRIGELVADTKSEAWARAVSTSVELTSQEEGGPLTKGALGLRRAVPGLRYFIPFITTPMNIFRLGLRKSPLGTLALPRTIFGAARTGDWSKVTARAVEQVIAWGVVLALMSNDPDDPWVMGTRSARSRGPRELALRTTPPQLVRIGGRWVSYARVEPLAAVLSPIVDVLGAVR